MSKLVDLTGKRFGRLTVIRRAPQEGRKFTRWECRCDCGNITMSDAYGLKKGLIQSCGCYHKEFCGEQHRTHGYTGTRLYRIYHKMKERCYRKQNHNFKWYGGCGVTVCDEWLKSFETFAKWAEANGYAENLTIDRIDPYGNYEPTNCRWITIQEQQKNKRKRGTVLCQ